MDLLILNIYIFYPGQTWANQTAPLHLPTFAALHTNITLNDAHVRTLL